MRANVGLALAFLAFVAPFAHAEVIRDERVKMTSPMSITIDAPAERTADAHAVIDVAYDEVDRLAALLSEWSPASDVSRVNAAAGSGTPV
ncbi:MAG TPA: hypothetical protein VNM87_04010, partial [Candidatus Udaeobacter sp.]|nr:hypothetical protein [Candidatus Udaeobacter sp.]